MTTTLENAARAVLVDLRGRKLLKYLFAEEPEQCGAYGYVEEPIEADVQHEIASALVIAVLKAIREDIPDFEASSISWTNEEIWHRWIDTILNTEGAT